jgi:hypothetical protein
VSQPGGDPPHDPGPPVEPRAALAHRAYFLRRDWRTALALWRAVAATGTATIEAAFAIAHCRIELAEPDELRTIAIADAPTASTGWLEAYAHLVRTRAFHWLTAQDPVRAAQLTRLLAVADPHLAEIYRDAVLPSAVRAPTVVTPAASAAPLPFQRALPLDDDDVETVLARHRGRRVMLLVPDYLEVGGQRVELDIHRVLRDVATLGMAVTVVNNYTVPPAEWPRFAELLGARIAAFRPDILIYQEMLLWGVSADPQVQPGLLDVLDAARRDFDTRVVFTYPDAWYDGMESLLESALELCDVFHVTHPAMLQRVSPALAAKMWCAFYPMVDPREPPAAPVEQVARAAFVGSINWVNTSRLVWWTEIARAGLPVDLYPTTSAIQRTPAQYADLLARYAIGLSFTTRTNGRRILTGRAAETPFYGSLLLEEESADTAYFMRPFEHFVPFTNLAELAARLEELLADPGLRHRIAGAGHAWTRRHFGTRPFWARLLRKLYETPRQLPAPRRHGYIPSAVVIPTTSAAVHRAYQPAGR